MKIFKYLISDLSYVTMGDDDFDDYQPTIDHFGGNLYIATHDLFYGDVNRVSKDFSDIASAWDSRDADMAQFGDPLAQVAKNPMDATVLLAPPVAVANSFGNVIW